MSALPRRYARGRHAPLGHVDAVAHRRWYAQVAVVPPVQQNGVGVSKQRDPFSGYCRNRHKRTALNTHVRADGVRQCMDCPSWQQRYISSAKRPAGKSEERTTEYRRVLSAAELAYLRRLIPCQDCGETQNDRGRTAHRPRCRVPYNREDDGTAGTPSRESTRAA